MISDIIIAFGELVKGWFAVKVTKINKEIAEINGEEEQVLTPAIGFVAPEEKDEEYEDEN